MGLLTLLFKRPKKSPYGTPCTTHNGEHVRSTAEKKIADFLAHHHIPYQYEPSTINGHRIPQGMGKPDFYLPNHDTYVEYWGLTHATKAYADQKQRKLHNYRDLGATLISLEPEDLNNLETTLFPSLTHEHPKKPLKTTTPRTPS